MDDVTVVFMAPGTLRDLLEERRDMHATIAHLEQRLQDAEADARRFCGLAGAAMRGEAVVEGRGMRVEDMEPGPRLEALISEHK